MKRLISVVLVAALLLAAVPVAVGPLKGLPWSPGEAASSTLTCSAKASCDAGEVAVFRMSGLANAHAGTPTGSSYTYRVCCSGVDDLGTDCSGNYDTVLALSGTDNAHLATTVGGAYTTEVCLSVLLGAVDCTYTSDDCDTGYHCLATISDTTNTHVADCDGTADYATKVCCSASACSVGVDTDGDDSDDDIECYLPTDPLDACPDNPTDDAWPLDINMDTYVTVVGDVLAYQGRIGAWGGPPPDAAWSQRLDLNMDNYITVVGDVLMYQGMIGQQCT